MVVKSPKSIVISTKSSFDKFAAVVVVAVVVAVVVVVVLVVVLAVVVRFCFLK